jgi:HlyD family secretion protein
MSAPTLFVLAQDLRQMQVNASVDEADIGRISAGQKVEFRVDAYPDETFAGTVKQVRLEPIVEQNVVSYVTVIDVPNPELKLKPGMTANVTIEIARADEVLRVPNAALRFRPTAEVFTALGQQAPTGWLPASTGSSTRGRDASKGDRASVWVLRDGHLARVRVETGLSDGTTTAVTGGELQDGANVVTAVAQVAAASTQRSGSPLLPQRPNRARTQGATR